MLPIIMLTARVNATTHRASQSDIDDSGADDYIVKPFDPEELIARIRSCASPRQGQDDLQQVLTHEEHYT